MSQQWDEWDDLPATTILPDKSLVEDQIRLSREAGAEEAPDPTIAKGQVALFDDGETHKVWAEWQGMPEFVQEDIGPWSELVVKFASREDRERFAELIGQPIRGEQYSIWYPQIRIGSYWDKLYAYHPEPPEPGHQHESGPNVGIGRDASEDESGVGEATPTSSLPSQRILDDQGPGDSGV